jgi:hypothetical protein
MPNVHREPESGSVWQWKDYEAGWGAGQANADWSGAVWIAFRTNPDGLRRQCYNVSISGNEFTELAQLMMKANPTAAIKAFGAAMQETPDIPAAHTAAAA